MGPKKEKKMLTRENMMYYKNCGVMEIQCPSICLCKQRQAIKVEKVQNNYNIKQKCPC